MGTTSSMWNSIVVAFASALTLFGLVLLPLPVPAGALVFAAGLSLLITRSDRAARGVRALRLRWRTMDSGLRFLERRSPAWLSNILTRTRPEAS